MNNSVSGALLTTNLIHIPQTADTELVQLAQGHLLRATVQRVADEMALLNFNGKAVMVQTDIPLQPQQRVILQVTQISPEKVSLQIVQQSPPPAEPGTAPALLPTNLETLLTSFGLEPDATNQTIAKALFAHSYSLNPDAISEVRTIWQQLPALTSLPAASGDKAAALEAVVYLHSHQLPINSESIALARHLLDNSLPIAQRLTTLQQTLQTLQTALTHTLTTPSASQQPAANSPQLANLFTTITATLSHLSGWSISEKMPSEQIAARLAEVITQLGTPPESQLAPRPATQFVVNGGSERGASPVPAQNGAPGPQPAPDAPAPAQPAAAQPTDSPAGPTPHPAAAQPALPESAAPLQRLAAVIHQTLATPNLDQSTAHALRQLSEQLQAVSKDLGAIQMSNLTNPANPINESYFLFPIPLQTADGPRTAHLRVFRRNNSTQTIDPHNLRLALLLDLPELGEIAVNLNVFERHLNGKIVSGRAQTHRLVEADLPDLFRSLRKLGYYIDSLTADRLAPRDKSIFEAASPADSIEVPLPQINITA